eukprot:2119546-Pleurochrysis_carterae.AAC.1
MSILAGDDSDEEETAGTEAAPFQPSAPSAETELTAVPMQGCAAKNTGRGTYVRAYGKGIRNDWPTDCKLRIDDIKSGSILVADTCSKDCSFGKHCVQNTFTVTLLKKCAASTFGESALCEEPPSKSNHEAVHVWLRLVFDCRVLNAEGAVASIDFRVEGRRLCCGAFRTAYCMSKATFDTICTRVISGDHKWVTYASTRTCSAAKDRPTLLLAATAWWRTRLGYYDMMPHLRRCIIHPVCVWKDVYHNEFVPHMQSRGYSWSLEEDRRKGSESTWRKGRKKALQQFADEAYGPGGKPFRLVSCSDHSAFKECSRCRELRLDLAKLLKEGADSEQIAEKKKEQKQHSDWFYAQRAALENMRQSGNRDDTIFEQVSIPELPCCSTWLCQCATHRLTHMIIMPVSASSSCKCHMCLTNHLSSCVCPAQSDKCGDDSLYTPGGGGRLSGENQSKYTYRISLQASHIFGKLWELSIILPMVITGADFGCTSLLNTLGRMMTNNELSPAKRRLVRGSDVCAVLATHFAPNLRRHTTD